MIKIKFLALAFFSFSFAGQVLALPLADSVGVENQNGKKIILHKADPKDNYYSIARRYHVRPKAIIDYNNNANIQIGSIIKVPTDRPFNQNTSVADAKKTPPANQNYNNRPAKTITTTEITTTTTNNPPANQPEYTQYKVSPGETLYAISKRFQVKVDDIIAWNNLKNNSLTPGEILKIKRGQTQETPAAAPVIIVPPAQNQTVVVEQHELKRDSTRVNESDSSYNSRRLPNNRYGLTEKNEKGTAVWIDDPNLDPRKKYVLHRTAPVGTIIKITNPLTNKTTFAKVVGSFTDNETNKDAVIVMTKDVAESLGAIDKRVYVTLSYGSPNPNE